MATEIIYPYPTPGVADLEARLMLAGVEVATWQPMSAYTIRDTHAGYTSSFGDIEADVVQIFSESEDLAEEIALPAAVDLGDMPDKIDYIYNKFTFIPDDRPAIVIPDASTPGMVVLAVVLRHGSTPVPNEEITVTMHETGDVHLDEAYEVDKSYIGRTNAQGVAAIEVFSSPKLKAAEYEPLYTVEARGVSRSVWVPDTGGVLHDLPTDDPSS